MNSEMYGGDDLEEDGFDSEDIEEEKKYFDENVWSNFKRESKDMTKKESCFACYMLGFAAAAKSFEDVIENVEEEVGKMSKEDVLKVLENEL